MKRSLIFLATLLLCYDAAQAQFEIGVSGGYNKNYLQTSSGYRAFTKYDALSGFVVGIPIQYHFNDWLAIQADPSYIQKNYEQSRNHFFDGIYQKSTNTYIQLPVMAHFSFGGKKLKGFFNAGGYGAYWAGGRIKGAMANVFNNAPDLPDNQQVYNFFQFDKAYNYNEKYTFDSRRDRRMEFGLVAGAGIEYLLQQKYRFFAEARYYYGLSDQQKNYMINQIPRYNDTYVIQAGCLFNIKNIFHSSQASAAE
ncbi:porin family protein [Chitinophaga sp. RAB17]|uniref:porin family protein n=1 Tax=Chitinophaga sp. RAB17 TaxID=3233049 RepID=UPI003F909FB3